MKSDLKDKLQSMPKAYKNYTYLTQLEQLNANYSLNDLINSALTQGRPEKLRGPGQRVKVGPRGKEVSILNHNFTQAVS